MAGLKKHAIYSACEGNRRPALFLLIGFWTCTTIAIAVVFRRIFALADPPRSAPPQLAGLDAAFASACRPHPWPIFCPHWSSY